MEWFDRKWFARGDEFSEYGRKFFKFHWDEKAKLITVICKNTYCVHHLSDEISDCNCGQRLADVLEDRNIPIRMFKGIDDFGVPVRKSMLGNERKECFLYEESITEKW